MILVFYGKDTFRQKRKLKEIIDYYKGKYKSGLNLYFFDLKKKNFQDFKNEVFSFPMFSEKKFFILENSILNQKFKEDFLKEVEKFKGKDFLLLFLERGDILKDKFFQKLKKYARFQEFKPLKPYQLRYWIKREFKKLNREIEKEAIEKLIFFVGNDLWQMENEIKKLVAFKRAGKITAKDVESVVLPNFEVNVFSIVEAIAKKNKKKALKLIYFYLERGEKISVLISLLKFQWRALLIIKDLIERKFKKREIPSQTGFHPFFVEKSFPLALNFDFSRLKKIYEKIFELDFKIKTGKIDPKIALTLFLLQL